MHINKTKHSANCERDFKLHISLHNIFIKLTIPLLSQQTTRVNVVFTVGL